MADHMLKWLDGQIERKCHKELEQDKENLNRKGPSGNLCGCEIEPVL